MKVQIGPSSRNDDARIASLFLGGVTPKWAEDALSRRAGDLSPGFSVTRRLQYFSIARSSRLESDQNTPRISDPISETLH